MKPDPDQRVPVGLDGTSHPSCAPNEHCRDAGLHPETRNRSFSLNSDEGHAALCRRSEAWIPNGSLPREPRVWDRPVIVETRPR